MTNTLENIKTVRKRILCCAYERIPTADRGVKRMRHVCETINSEPSVVAPSDSNTTELPLIAGVTEREYLVLQPVSHRVHSCAAGARCEARRIQVALAVGEVLSARQFRPPFVYTLRCNTLCLLCLDKRTRNAIALALWTGTAVDSSSVTHRYTGRPGMFPSCITAAVALRGFFHQQTPAAYSMGVDGVTGAACLVRL
jgi:hypothetical protein